MNDDRRPSSSPEPLWMRFGPLLFGLLLLGYLVAIDRPHWFELKPASGSARAMAMAAETPGEGHRNAGR